MNSVDNNVCLKNQINEINILRPSVIVILVFMHAFTIYSGGTWEKPRGIYDMSSYFWLSKVAYSCLLETFVFISGYVMGYQLITLKKCYNIKILIKKKARRLILPSFIFSTLYVYLITGDYKFDLKTIYGLINAQGHMWFLPMLFWCFIFGYIVYKIPISERIKLIILFFSSILVSQSLPLRISSSFYYLPFFYLGIFIYRNKERLISVLLSYRLMLVLVVTYLILFILCTVMKKNGLQYNIKDPQILKFLFLLFLHYSKVIYAGCGMILLYLISVKISMIWKTPKWLFELNSLCFGIYIFQQFVLKWLYYQTNFSVAVGTYMLPWFGFIIALFVSILLSYMLRRTSIGKIII